MPDTFSVIMLWLSVIGIPAIPSAILGVKEEYLEAAFDEMTTKYGTIENYFSEGLGIDAAQQKAVRDLYLGTD